MCGLSSVLAQTTNLTFSQANTGPYYSISNLIVVGSATILANDPVVSSAVSVNYTNNYLNGTNYSGGLLYPAGVKNSRYVAFGLTITTTNASNKGTYIGTIQGGTGSGDWVSLVPPLVVTTTGQAAGNVSTNATYDTGGLTQFRLSSIVQSGESNYTAQATVGTSSKPGI